MTKDFQYRGILTSVDSYEPVQPPFKLRNVIQGLVGSLSHKIFKRPTKALISLRVCAGCSEALLVAHTKLLEISCGGSLVLSNMINSQEKNRKKTLI